MGGLKYAMVCSSNQNRSMEAHRLLQGHGYQVKLLVPKAVSVACVCLLALLFPCDVVQARLLVNYQLGASLATRITGRVVRHWTQSQASGPVSTRTQYL